VETAQAAEAAAGNTHGLYGAAPLSATEGRTGTEHGSKEIVDTGAIVGIVGRYFFTALGIFVPVIETVLLVGVDVALFFLAASGNGKCADQDKRNLKCTSSSHKYILPCWLIVEACGTASDELAPYVAQLLPELNDFASLQN
jgi:hypothetical protein